MARHREPTTWTFSRARHRGPGSVELLVRRGSHTLLLSLASVVLATALLTWDPVFENRI
jgi:hypothetical protein